MATKVSLSFVELSDAELDNFAQGVIDALTGNATYPTPPVTVANLQAAVDEYTDKMAAAQTGSRADRAARNNSRETLVEMLRKVATYVQMMCNNNPALLLSSGFDMQSTSRVSAELEKPQALRIKNGAAAQLIARVKAVKNANMYEGRAKAGNGDWLPSIFAGDSRRILFNNLTPGTMYTIQVRALGGSTGHSDWSDPSSHMAM
jgi:hypothetical protein